MPINHGSAAAEFTKTVFARALGGSVTSSSVFRTLATIAVTSVVSISIFHYYEEHRLIDGYQRTILVQMIRAVAAEERRDPMEVWGRISAQAEGSKIWPAQLTRAEAREVMYDLAEEVDINQMVSFPPLPGAAIAPPDGKMQPDRRGLSREPPLPGKQ
jgi:hypothetical protein